MKTKPRPLSRLYRKGSIPLIARLADLLVKAAEEGWTAAELDQEAAKCVSR